jgi:hypothetical protein
MLYINILLFAMLSCSLIYVVYLIKKNWAQQVLNNVIAEEMRVIVENTIVTLNSRREKIKAQGAGVPVDDIFGDPSLMAAILTTIVKKYGNIKVGLEDFRAVKDEDYISVYSDNTSKELILSLDPNLASVDQVPKGFYKTDDGTFH